MPKKNRSTTSQPSHNNNQLLQQPFFQAHPLHPLHASIISIPSHRHYGRGTDIAQPIARIPIPHAPTQGPAVPDSPSQRPDYTVPPANSHKRRGNRLTVPTLHPSSVACLLASPPVISNLSPKRSPFDPPAQEGRSFAKSNIRACRWWIGRRQVAVGNNSVVQ